MHGCYTKCQICHFLKLWLGLEPLQFNPLKKSPMTVKPHPLLACLKRSSTPPNMSISVCCPQCQWDCAHGSKCTTSNEWKKRQHISSDWMLYLVQCFFEHDRKQYWPLQTYTAVSLQSKPKAPSPGTTRRYQMCWREPHAGIHIATLAEHGAQQLWALLEVS